jgi:hypothetical protein
VKLLRRLDVATLRAAAWALRAVRQTRRELRSGGLREIDVIAPPNVPETAGRGVAYVVRRLEPTCLERALVLQRWLSAHRRPTDVIIGVARPNGTYRAHAWLEGEPVGNTPYQELTRIPAR